MKGRAKQPRGKLLLAAPCLPSERLAGRLLATLAPQWEVHPAWTSAGDHDRAADQLLENLKHLISANDYVAILVVDHPSVTAALVRLRLFTRLPIVRVLGGGRKSVRGARPLERLSAREDAAKARASASEAWSFNGNGDALALHGRLDLAWLNRRLAALSRPAPPAAPGLISIIIPCFNNLRYTRECLAQLAQNTRAPYELIIIDNGSKDGTAAFVKKHAPGARLIRNPRNLGFARAINQGMRAARGQYVVWLNNDVIVTPGWLEGLTACAERSSRIGAVGPCTNETVGFQRVARADYRGLKGLRYFAQSWSLMNQGRAMEVHRLIGFCLLLKRDVARQVGLLDERFNPACYEDYDYCLRVRQAGFDLACALDVFVHHHGHKSFSRPANWLDQTAASREVFMDKWCHRTLQFLDELDPEAAASNRGRGRA